MCLRNFVCFCISLAIIVGGCSGPTPKKPAPTVRVVETPGSRELKGWERPYTVDGKRYDPLRSHHGFIEEGIASWYGRDFHGRKTSNGEIYDMHAMTAAHKTLPLGIFVRVKNFANGRETVVRLNDRGPFVKGRVIDLSFAAARELDIVGPGTAPVRVEALGYQERDSSGRIAYRQPASYNIGSYSVQVGAFTVADNAKRLAAELQGRFGYAAVHQGWVGGTLFHRVRAGRYTTLEAAEAARIDFERLGYASSFVVAME